MTIEDYITKHSLSPVRIGPWKPSVLLMDEDKLGEDSQYEYYASADRTLWVALNRTKLRFRICHNELTLICTDWLQVGMNYETEPFQAT